MLECMEQLIRTFCFSFASTPGTLFLPTQWAKSAANPPLNAQKILAKNRCLESIFDFWPCLAPPSDILGARMRNSWVFFGLLVDPKGDPQEPLREAAWNRRFRRRICFRKTGSQVKYFRKPRFIRVGMQKKRWEIESKKVCKSALQGSVLPPTKIN